MNDNHRSDLELLRQSNILFGHQSVGVDVLNGVQLVAADAGVEGVRMITIQEAVESGGGFLVDARLGNNGDPASKCSDFLRMSLAFPPGRLDVAAMKFCYADITPKTNVREIFEIYRRTVDTLRSARPNLVIVHCTVPLTARTALWRRLAKQVLGREDASDVGNKLRKQYNDLLRQQYAGEPIYDIATCESTYPDSSRCSFEADGQEVYSLIDEYADDGRHPNKRGSKIVGAEFVRVLAEALSKKKQPVMVDSKPAGGSR